MIVSTPVGWGTWVHHIRNIISKRVTRGPIDVFFGQSGGHPWEDIAKFWLKNKYKE